MEDKKIARVAGAGTDRVLPVSTDVVRLFMAAFRAGEGMADVVGQTWVIQNWLSK